jgi:predicted HTH transcriptional regulator
MLLDLIARGEGTHLEFKSTIDSAVKIAKTLAAFANTSGGILLVGIRDDRKVQGITSEQLEMEKIEAAADFLCDPPVPVSYESKQLEGKQILVIRIQESVDKPHTLKDPHGNRVVYVRAKDKSVPVGKRMTDLLHSVQQAIDPVFMHSANVKTLLSYLQKNGSINGKRFAKLINVSERRAAKMLMELARQNVLLLHDHQQQAVSYSLKQAS